MAVEVPSDVSTIHFPATQQLIAVRVASYLRRVLDPRYTKATYQIRETGKRNEVGVILAESDRRREMIGFSTHTTGVFLVSARPSHIVDVGNVLKLENSPLYFQRGAFHDYVTAEWRVTRTSIAGADNAITVIELIRER